MSTKIISRRDGESGKKWETFSSSTPNTYEVINCDKVVGEIFSTLDPNFPKYKVRLWYVLFYGKGKATRFNNFQEAKKWAKEF